MINTIEARELMMEASGIILNTLLHIEDKAKSKKFVARCNRWLDEYHQFEEGEGV